MIRYVNIGGRNRCLATYLSPFILSTSTQQCISEHINLFYIQMCTFNNNVLYLCLLSVPCGNDVLISRSVFQSFSCSNLGHSQTIMLSLEAIHIEWHIVISSSSSRSVQQLLNRMIDRKVTLTFIYYLFLVTNGIFKKIFIIDFVVSDKEF